MVLTKNRKVLLINKDFKKLNKKIQIFLLGFAFPALSETASYI